MNIVWNILTIILALALLLFLAGFLMVYYFFVRQGEIGNRDLEKKASHQGEQYDAYFKEAVEGIEKFEQVRKEDLCIDSFDGLKLKAWLWEADEQTDKTMILVHGYRSYGIYEFGSRLEFLHSLGWNILLVDNRAHGRSEGRYIGFGNLDVRDVQKWTDLIIQRYGENCKILLHGVSMGSATVLATAGQADCPAQIKAVVADCGYSSGYEEVKGLFGSWLHLPKFPLLPISYWWHKVLTGYDLKTNAAADLISNYKGKLLIIHGGNDDFVPTFMGPEIFEAATCQKELFIAPEAEHAMSYTVCKEEYQKRFANLAQSI